MNHPIRTTTWLVALALGAGAACRPAPSTQPDAGLEADAAPPGCTTWFEDQDGDGHGNPAVSQIACAAPAGYVLSSDDCDDTSAARFPGNKEVCDLLDNDCSPDTAETCPAGCDVRVSPQGGRYLFCIRDSAERRPFNSVVAACAADGYQPIKIDDDVENWWVAINIDFASVPVYLGATDAAVEGTWRWLLDNSTAAYTNWSPGQPDDADATQNCMTMDPIPYYGDLGKWSDTPCDGTYAYICERPR